MTLISYSEFVYRLATVFDKPGLAEADPRSSLVDDLGLDSIELYEATLLAESTAGCLDPPPDNFPDLSDLQSLYTYYSSCVQAQNHPAVGYP